MKKIKTIIVTLTLLLCFVNLRAQRRQIILTKDNPHSRFVKGTYYKIPEDIMKEYEGIWAYKNEKKTFKIKIKRKKFFFKDIYWDKLEGTYCYTTGSDCRLDDKTAEFQIDALGLISKEFNYFSFNDANYDKLGRATFKVLENGKAKWTLRNLPGLRPIINGVRLERKGFSVPTDAIFTKIAEIPRR